MPQGMESLYTLIGEAVWNKLAAKNAKADSTKAPGPAAPGQDYPTMSPAQGYPEWEALLRDQPMPPQMQGMPMAGGYQFQTQPPQTMPDDYVKASIYGDAYRR